METNTPEKTVKAPIYTHGKYWGGAVLPYWLFLVFTALPLTGFFGIDHLLFRSPSTALFKGVTNIFTLGLWYFYDIIQAFNDKEFVKEYGFSKPAVGPAGLALDYFTGISDKDKTKPKEGGILSVLTFIAYIFTLFVPFGISNFIAGDNSAGAVKLLLSLIPFVGLFFWIPYFWLGSIFESYRILTSPEALFEKGTLNVPPLSMLVSANGFAPNIMNPASIEKEKQKEANDTFWNNWVKPLLSFIPFMDVLDTTKCAVVPPIKQTVDAAQTAATGVVAITKTVPEIASKATGTLTAFTDPAAIKELAAKQAVQAGGAILGSQGNLDWIVMGGLLLLVAGGFGASLLRKYHASNQSDEPRKASYATDAPPNPGGV